MSAVFKSYPLENDLQMAAVVLRGLPSSVVKRIGTFLGIRATKVGSIGARDSVLEARVGIEPA